MQFDLLPVALLSAAPDAVWEEVQLLGGLAQQLGVLRVALGGLAEVDRAVDDALLLLSLQDACDETQGHCPSTLSRFEGRIPT